mgnify:CR=1 FL=1
MLSQGNYLVNKRFDRRKNIVIQDQFKLVSNSQDYLTKHTGRELRIFI